MEFLASDFKRKGRKKKRNIYVYIAIATPNLWMLPVEQRGLGREAVGLLPWGLGSSVGMLSPKMLLSAPKRCFLPCKADSRAK